MPQLGHRETFPHRQTLSLSLLRSGCLQFKQIERHLNGDVDLYASVKHSVVLLKLPQWDFSDECVLPNPIVYVAPLASTLICKPGVFCGEHFVALLRSWI